MTILLTQHFTLDEFLHSDTASAQGIDNTPTTEVTVRLAQLAIVMAEVRIICGRHPVLISSGYRCPQLNAAVGGATNSAHLYGCAADFTIPDFGTPLDICTKLGDDKTLRALYIDQLIHENNSWVHLGLANPWWDEPRHQCLTISDGTTTEGFT